MAAAPPARRLDSGGDVFDRLARRQFLVVSGKGGVGRTTMAALLGLAMAARGRRTLVVTTGHDDRLAWMLGEAALTDAPNNVGPGLAIQRLILQTCVREYGALVMRSARVAHAVFDNKIVRNLLHAIPGLDDFAVLGKAWHEATRSGNYDTVVFDGPATGHLMYTLGVPHAIVDTVPPGPMSKESELIKATLADPERSEAILVGLPELWPLTELAELGVALHQRIGIRTETIIVNGLWPKLSQVPTADASDPDAAALLAHLAELAAVGQGHRKELQTWLASEAPRDLGITGALEVPWQWRGPCDRPSLEALWAQLDPRAAAATIAS